MTRHLLIGLLIFGGLANTLQAQPSDIAFERFILPGGVDENRIMSIASDHQGYMWFGTTAGLFRFDGYTFKKYALHSGDVAWNAEFVWDLHVDREGMILVASMGGLVRLDPESEELAYLRHDPDNPDSPSDDPVRAVLEDRPGNIWLGSSRGLYRFAASTKTFSAFLHDPNDPATLTAGEVSVVYEDRQGALWIGTCGSIPAAGGGGLARFDPSTETFTRFRHIPQDETSLADNCISALYEDAQGTFWVGTLGDGLHTMDRDSSTFKRHRYDPGDPGKLSRPHALVESPNAGNAYVSFVHQDPSGMMWIGAKGGGVNRYDPATNRVWHFEADPDDSNSLSNNRVSAIGESHDGTIWIGSMAGDVLGLHKVVPVPPLRHRSPHPTGSDTPNEVAALWESRDGSLWIGTDGGGLSRLDRAFDSYTHFRHDPDDAQSLGSENIWAIHETRDSVLWIGTEGGGLNSFDRATGTFTRYGQDAPHPAGARDDLAIAIYEDREGLLWVSMFDGIVSRFDRETEGFTHHRLHRNGAKNLTNEWVLAINESRDGSLWIGTTRGLSRFDRHTEVFVHYVNEPQNPASISPGRVTSVCEGRGGRLWIGTDGGGLNELDRKTERFVHFAVANSRLPSDQVLGILEDDIGNLWISTEKTITRFDPDTEVFHSYPLDHEQRWEGLRHGGHHKGRDGRLYFGSASGFFSFSSEEVLRTENQTPPQVVLTGMRLFDEDVQPGEDAPLKTRIGHADEIRLNHRENVFSLDFVALHYSNPVENRYAYMLEGYDDDWRDGEFERTATYYKVPPGAYTFRVKAASSYGIWSEEDAWIPVIILPPWWRTWWAYIVYTLGLGLVVFAGYELRVRGLRRQAIRLRTTVAERTSDLLAEKERTEEQARRLVKLDEVKDRFFANISHEFRTPLTLILGPIEDALGGAFGNLTSNWREQLLMMRRSGRRLHRLISQLLDLSKLEVGRMLLQARQGNLVAFLDEIVMSFSPLAERKHVSLRFEPETSDLSVYFDADKLEKVVANLLANAFKFTPEHGGIRVIVAEVTDENRGGVEIRVIDTGPGIPSEEIPRIFDRFHQVDTSSSRAGEGTGIGLALAKELIELQSGQITVESEEGSGSTFVVRLPLGKSHFAVDELAEEIPEEARIDEGYPEPEWPVEKETADMMASEEAVEEMERAATILIVEDNADVRAYLKRHLDGLYTIVEAGDGIEGLERARKTRPDLVISDVMMPRMDGFALCRAIKEDKHLHHIPVVLLTSRASEEAEIRGLEAGADDYITKPFSADALMARVENLIEIRRLLRERFSHEVTIQPGGVTVDSAKAQFLEKVRDAIDAHLGDSNFTVDWLADEVAMSTRQLRRRLRALVNLSPSGYIRMIRLERAAQLLAQEAGTISEVAYRVGFSDPHYFSRLFHQTFGKPPSVYADRQE